MNNKTQIWRFDPLYDLLRVEGEAPPPVRSGVLSHLKALRYRKITGFDKNIWNTYKPKTFALVFFEKVLVALLHLGDVEGDIPIKQVRKKYS